MVITDMLHPDLRRMSAGITGRTMDITPPTTTVIMLRTMEAFTWAVGGLVTTTTATIITVTIVAMGEADLRTAVKEGFTADLLDGEVFPEVADKGVSLAVAVADMGVDTEEATAGAIGKVGSG